MTGRFLRKVYWCKNLNNILVPQHLSNIVNRLIYFLPEPHFLVLLESYTGQSVMTHCLPHHGRLVNLRLENNIVCLISLHFCSSHFYTPCAVALNLSTVPDSVAFIRLQSRYKNGIAILLWEVKGAPSDGFRSVLYYSLASFGMSTLWPPTTFQLCVGLPGRFVVCQLIPL